MLSEQITVTTTPTSLADLIGSARGLAAGEFAVSKCIGVKLRYAVVETATISLTDTVQDGGSATGAIVLDAAGESLMNTSFKQIDIGSALLNSSAGNITVHVIIEQPRV